MNIAIQKQRTNLFYRLLSAFVAMAFLVTTIVPTGFAQGVIPSSPATTLNLPIPGTMVGMSEGFTPAMVKGLTIHPENPLLFDFIVGTGDTNLDGEALKEESRKLIKYFLASLTVPEQEMWVNLSPYEADRIIPGGLGDTEMGRDMLAQDYLLKQLTSSLMYPEDELGEAFWERVHERAYEEFGTTDIPMNTFNKIWIVPEKAVVYEHEEDASAYVVESHLKVMLEEDYEALNKNKINAESRATLDNDSLRGISTEIIRQILIPEIEREVNQGKTFANLRQIFNSMILATWYKQNLKQSLLGQVYVDQNKTKGVDTQDKAVTQKIYDQYIEAFRKGVYDYIREDYDPATQQIIPRKYFSGGIKANLAMLVKLQTIKPGNDVSVGNLENLFYGNEDTYKLRTEVTDLGMASEPMEVINKAVKKISELTIESTKKSAGRFKRKFGKFKKQVVFASIMTVLFLGYIPLSLYAKTFTQEEVTSKFAQGILSLSDPNTRIPPSHFGHPGYENLSFLYDQSINPMLLKVAGDQEEAEYIIDYFTQRLHIPLSEVIKNANLDGIYGILKTLEGNKGRSEFVVSLINAVDRTSTKRQGQGLLEYLTTPGPMSFMILSMINVNPAKYLTDAVTLGEVLLSMRRFDGAVIDGDRWPNRVHTEPHMDAFAAFLQLYQLTRQKRWLVAAEHAYQWFETNVYHPGKGEIYQGIWETGPSTIFATDAYSWTMAGPAGDRMFLGDLEIFTNTMLTKSLTQVTLELPDGQTKTIILVDFTDPGNVHMKITDPDAPQGMVERGGFHPMGSMEWTGGVILALQKNAVRFWNSGKAHHQETAQFYKGLAELLIKESLQGFYELEGLEGLLTFYATGQGVPVGHGWDTPFYNVNGKSGQTIRGGSPVGGWPILPMNGVNPFIFNDNYKKDYDKISMNTEAKQKAQKYVNKIVANRFFRESVPTETPEAATQIVEPGNFNLQMWGAFNRGDYREAIRWAEKVVGDPEWVRLAQRDQKHKAQNIGGLVRYRWGVSPSLVPQAESAIWRYPLLNEMGAAMWGLAASHYELGNTKEVKKWMRRIIEEIPYHQIYAPSGPGYWNALISWQYNPGGHHRDRKMGVIYKQVLSEMGLRSAAPKEVSVRGKAFTSSSKDTQRESGIEERVTPPHPKLSSDGSKIDREIISYLQQLTIADPHAAKNSRSFKRIENMGEEAVPSLIRIVQKHEVEGDPLKWAAYLLGVIGDEKVRPVIESIINDSSYPWYVHTEARNGLNILKQKYQGQKGGDLDSVEPGVDQKVVSYLEQLTIPDPNAAKYSQPFRAIVNMGEKAVPTLIRVVQNREIVGDPLKWAAYLLGVIGDEEVEPVLQRVINDSSYPWYVQTEAKNGLRVLNRRLDNSMMGMSLRQKLTFVIAWFLVLFSPDNVSSSNLFESLHAKRAKDIREEFPYTKKEFEAIVQEVMKAIERKYVTGAGSNVGISRVEEKRGDFKSWVIKQILLVSEGEGGKGVDGEKESESEGYKSMSDKVERIRTLIKDGEYQDVINIFDNRSSSRYSKKGDDPSIDELLEFAPDLVLELLRNYFDQTVELILRKADHGNAISEFISSLIEKPEGIPFAIDIIQYLKNKFKLLKKVNGSYPVPDKEPVIVMQKGEQLYSETIQNILKNLFYKSKIMGSLQGASQEFYNALGKEFGTDWVSLWEAKVLQPQLNRDIEQMKLAIADTNSQISTKLSTIAKELIVVPTEVGSKFDNRKEMLDKNLGEIKQNLNSLSTALRNQSDKIFEVTELNKFANRADLLIPWLHAYRVNYYLSGPIFLDTYMSNFSEIRGKFMHRAFELREFARQRGILADIASYYIFIEKEISELIELSRDGKDFDKNSITHSEFLKKIGLAYYEFWEIKGENNYLGLAEDYKNQFYDRLEEETGKHYERLDVIEFYASLQEGSDELGILAGRLKDDRVQSIKKVFTSGLPPVFAASLEIVSYDPEKTLKEIKAIAEKILKNYAMVSKKSIKNYLETEGYDNLLMWLRNIKNDRQRPRFIHGSNTKNVTKLLEWYFAREEWELSKEHKDGNKEKIFEKYKDIINDLDPFSKLRMEIVGVLKKMGINDSNFMEHREYILEVAKSIHDARNASQDTDEAMMVNKENFGGINLDPAMLDLQIKRDGKGVPLPVGDQDFSMMHIQGFLPIIINVTPVSLPALLGFVDTLPGEQTGLPVASSGGLVGDVSLWLEDWNRFLLRQDDDISVLSLRYG